MSLELILSLLSIVGFIITSIINVKEIQKSHDETIRWQQKTEDAINTLTERVDEHNNYAKLFQETSNDISFIKGKMEGIEK